MLAFPMMTRRTSRLIDVAERAGVSNSTVSNAFNHPERVAPSVLERVMSAAQELRYHGPSAIAAGLRSGTTNTVAVFLAQKLSDGLRDPATQLVLEGIGAAAEEAGCNVLLVPAGQRPELIGTALADCAIAYSPGDDHRLVAAARATGLPLVLIDSGATADGDSEVGSVMIDDRAATRLQVEHLLRLGHRRIAFVIDQEPGGRSRTWGEGIANSHPCNRQRLLGWQETLNAHGLDAESLPLFWVNTLSHESGVVACSRLLRRSTSSRPTAIVCAADIVALGVLAALNEAKLGVEQCGSRGVSVVGFDNIAAAEGAGLTTISQPHYDKGHVAATMALAMSGGRGVVRRSGPRTRILPTQLVVRSSTGKPFDPPS
jgi:DNA-binding LacI/PurR family transcriptional regulator